MARIAVPIVIPAVRTVADIITPITAHTAPPVPADA